MYSNINRYRIKSHKKPYFLIPGFIFRVTCSRPPKQCSHGSDHHKGSSGSFRSPPLAPSRPPAYDSPVKMDRNHITIGTRLQLENQDRQYWAEASPSEKFETITYLRECFYGEEATTGRLPRVYRVLKR